MPTWIPRLARWMVALCVPASSHWYFMAADSPSTDPMGFCLTETHSKHGTRYLSRLEHAHSACNLVMAADLLNLSEQANPMDRKICLYLSLAVGLSLLATVCSRHSTSQAGSRRSKNSPPLNSPPASGIASSVSKPFRPADSSTQVTERPSPFFDLRSAEPPPKAPTPVPNGIGNAHQSVDRPTHGVKPFIPPPPLVSNLARREMDAALPVPPVFDAPAIKLAESRAFTGTVGSTATATYEMPNPKRHPPYHSQAGRNPQTIRRDRGQVLWTPEADL